MVKQKQGKLGKLLRELSSDEEDSNEENIDGDSQSPWMKEFNLYLHSGYSLSEGMTVVQWWEVSVIYVLV